MGVADAMAVVNLVYGMYLGMTKEFALGLMTIMGAGGLSWLRSARGRS